MKRTARDKTQQPTPAPVEKIELSDKHTTLRLVLALVFLAIGAGALIFLFVSMLSKETGWQKIDVRPTEASTVGDISLYYELGSGKKSATAEYRELTALYQEWVISAYRVLDATGEYAGCHNLAYLNKHVNETVEVDEGLYTALSQLQEANSRYLYYAPLYDTYDQLFSCESDGEAAAFAPTRNSETASYFAEIARFAADPHSIDLQLLGNNTVRLTVSDEYLAFSKENDIFEYLDFFVTRNAFAMDYISDRLQKHGFTHGVLLCDDGLVRNLDPRETDFSFGLTFRVNNTVYPAGTLHYRSPQTLVRLHNYPDKASREDRYYEFADGTVISGYIRPSDGQSVTAMNDLIGVSSQKGCGQLMLELLSVYTAENDSPSSLSCDYVICDGTRIMYRGDTLSVTDLYTQDDVTFTAEKVG